MRRILAGILFLTFYLNVNGRILIEKISLHQYQPAELDHAKIARTLVYRSDWASMGTLSTVPAIAGFPMVNIISMADSPRNGAPTGAIYYLLTDLDFTGKDLNKDNRLTVMLTEAVDKESNCTRRQLDPMEPTCARVIFSGSSHKMKKEVDDDYDFGINAIISRHPAAIDWLKAHYFYLCKMNIEQIQVLDFYGGPHNVSVEDYYNVKFSKSDFHKRKSHHKKFQLKFNLNDFS